jgi:hypothetical protein
MVFKKKKGTALGYGGIFAIAMLASAIVVYMVSSGDVKRGIVTGEGNRISFVNDAEFLTKSFNESIKFASSRAAYDLARAGGLEYENYWTPTYPKMELLTNNLIEKIKDNLPTSYEEEQLRVTWGESDIDIPDEDVYLCDSLEDSECFFIKGKKYFSVYDKSSESIISLDLPIDFEIASSYFNLMYIGRQILENNAYSSLLNDATALSNKLHNDFPGRNFTITAIPIADDIDDVDIIIRDYYCPTDFHCLAPLEPHEPKAIWGGNYIPYDYLTLHFKTKAEQTGFSDPDFDFTLQINPETGETIVIC